MKRAANKRLLREETGFTLPEMMVTMVVMLTVLFALYSIFDMSLRVFALGNDKVEAVENARLGLEKMERELRTAYPVDKANGQNHLFFGVSYPATDVTPTSPVEEITFGNDLNGDRRVTCTIPASCEYITYKLSPVDPANPGAPRTLKRANSSSPSDAGQDVVDYVGEFDNGPPDPSSTETPGNQSDDTPGLRFIPLTENFTTPTSASQVRVIRVDLAIVKDGRKQTLTTNVTLRNKGNW